MLLKVLLLLREFLDAAIEMVAGAEVPATKPDIDKFEQSPNHSSRSGAKIDTIVLHNTDSSFASAYNWLMNSPRPNRVSAHFLLGRDGTLFQLCALDKKAWHAGAINARSIGIEIEAHSAATGMTSLQQKKLVQLVRWLMKKYNISKSNIIPHRDVSSTDCPMHIWPSNTELNEWKNQYL